MNAAALSKLTGLNSCDMKTVALAWGSADYKINGDDELPPAEALNFLLYHTLVAAGFQKDKVLTLLSKLQLNIRSAAKTAAEKTRGEELHLLAILDAKFVQTEGMTDYLDLQTMELVEKAPSPINIFVISLLNLYRRTAATIPNRPASE